MIEEFESMKIAAETLGVKISCINNSIEKKCKCKGWYLVKMRDFDENAPNPYNKKKPSRVMYKITQLDDNNNIIATFNTFVEASKIVNISPSKLSAACIKNKKSSGYYWKKEKVNK